MFDIPCPQTPVFVGLIVFFCSPKHGYCVIVQVLSGDTVIVRGPPKGGPPPERTIGLSNVTAPRLARRPGISDEAKESKDEVGSCGILCLRRDRCSLAVPNVNTLPTAL